MDPLAEGPPPPARGARAALARHPPRVGTTPACAGSTATVLLGLPVRKDHPRLRGEHEQLVPDDVRSDGPPPPARGAPQQCD